MFMSYGPITNSDVIRIFGELIEVQNCISCECIQMSKRIGYLTKSDKT